MSIIGVTLEIQIIICLGYLGLMWTITKMTYVRRNNKAYRAPFLVPCYSLCTSIGQKKDTQGIPPLKRKNGKGVAQSDLEKAEEFNGQFTDVFNKNEHTQVPLLDRSAPFMNDIAVSKDGVIKLLKGLNPSKALGPDELHPRVLKELATELGPVFAHLFQ